MDITWDKPMIEFAKIENGEPTTWTKMPTQEENTVKQTTEKGTAKELFGEGHELVARKAQKSKYVLTMDIFVDKGDAKPIPDEDGIVVDMYAVRLTPNDESLTGFMFPQANVEMEEKWSSEKGAQITYTFTSVKKEGEPMKKPYKKV